jgi:hypothetical protein
MESSGFSRVCFPLRKWHDVPLLFLCDVLWHIKKFIKVKEDKK